MLSKIFLCTLIGLSSIICVEAGVWDQVTNAITGKTNTCVDPSIRVLLVHDIPSINLEVKGQYTLYDPNVKDGIGNTRFAGKSRMIQALGSGLKWGEEFPSQHQLKITHDKPESLSIINGNQYRGEIFVYDIGGTISIINQVPLETYVRYVLSSNYPEEAEPEVLFALAIVARTNAYFHAANPKTKYWDVDANLVGYRGQLQSSKLIDQAVEMTRHMIISRTGVYEGVLTPFAVQFDQLALGLTAKDVTQSKITLEEANEMAKKGDHAAQILTKAFPGSTVMLIPCK